MEYKLKYKDIDCLTFNILEDNRDLIISNINVINKKLLPIDLDIDHIDRWLKNRTIPENRAYVSNFLSKLNLSEKRKLGIINISKCLSLNDSFWVVPIEFDGTFSKYNLYENRFSNILSNIVFTGYGSNVKTTFKSSPEFTTNGMLAKCWRRVNGKIMLYKSGTEGFANSGNEPYSEFLAYQIADKMRIKATKYNLNMWKNKLCSTCELFTNQNFSFIPASGIVKSSNIEEIFNFYKKLGEKYYDNLISMFLLDALILNTDRHLGNFGFIIDNDSNKIVETAPIFDNGLSLLCYSMDEDYQEFLNYSKTRTPALYNDFYTILKGRLNKEHKNMLKRLINFKFKLHSRYNLDKTRIKFLEKLIEERVNYLLSQN